MRRFPTFTLAACSFAACLFSACSNVTMAAAVRHDEAQAAAASQQPTASQRTRLFLRDGTFQSVLGYTVKAGVVTYRSAERNGTEEQVPLSLVDLAATRAWARQHADGDSPQHPVLSPELAKEEAARAARTPEILPGLRLPEEDSVVALDMEHNAPELVPLSQRGGDLNGETAHDVRRQAINPAAAAHDILDLDGSAAEVQMHTATPAFFVRIGSDDGRDPGGSAITVDTQGRAGRADSTGGAASSDYVLVRLRARSDNRKGPRTDSRELDSFRIADLDQPGRPHGLQPQTTRPQADVVELEATSVPGGKWLKLTPAHPLEEAEYALVEVLSASEVNLLVWDFGVHAQARENDEAIHPQTAKPPTLERR
jgi:hypothetical protein